MIVFITVTTAGNNAEIIIAADKIVSIEPKTPSWTCHPDTESLITTINNYFYVMNTPEDIIKDINQALSSSAES